MALAAVGLVLGAVGIGVQMYGQKKQTEALNKAEDARKQQLALDSIRKRREIIRNILISRSNAEFSAAGQGASFGSALPGAYGGISGQGGGQTLAVNQNEQLGGQIFSANKDYYNASGITGLGQGLQSLGGMFMTNAGTISKIGQTIGGRVSPNTAFY